MRTDCKTPRRCSRYRERTGRAELAAPPKMCSPLSSAVRSATHSAPRRLRAWSGRPVASASRQLRRTRASARERICTPWRSSFLKAATTTIRRDSPPAWPAPQMDPRLVKVALGGRGCPADGSSSSGGRPESVLLWWAGTSAVFGSGPHLEGHGRNADFGHGSGHFFGRLARALSEVVGNVLGGRDVEHPNFEVAL